MHPHAEQFTELAQYNNVSELTWLLTQT